MSLVRYELRGEAAWITLASPATRNALSAAMLAELAHALRSGHADPAARSLVLAAEGPVFCAGADLKDGMGPRTGGDRAAPTRHPLVAVLELVRHGEKPVVCALGGSAFGGGVGLVAAADIAIAADGAKLAFSEVRVGVVPAIIAVVVLPKLGEHHARRLFLTGERFDAARALDYGLVHRVVAPDALVSAVEQELDTIHRGGPLAVAEAKKLVSDLAGLGEAQAFTHTAALSERLFASEEASEGMAAFREKRPPRWVRSPK